MAGVKLTENQKKSGQYYGREYYRFYLLFIIFVLCCIFYYFGEIVDYFRWEALGLDFFYGVHDIHRLIFLIPIMYTAYYFGLMPTVIIIILTICVFLPRAIFISPYPDPILRASLFTIIAAATGIFTAVISDQDKKKQKYIKKQEWQYFQTLNEVDDGVMLVSSDHKILFLNETLKKEFGEGQGAQCYTYLHNRDIPCAEICKMDEVLKGKNSEIQCEISGKKYRVSVLPYFDLNGKICQLSIFKIIK
jgi:hypothetical protein